VRQVDPEERRVRLARRHCLTPESRAAKPEQAARSIVCLHGTDPSTVYLSAGARTKDFKVSDLDRALYEDRTLVKHLAMRRTLFVFPRDSLGIAQAGASLRVLTAERKRLINDVEKAGLHKNGERWLKKAWAAVLEALNDGRELTSTELRKEVPLLEGSIVYGEGKSWGGKVPIGPRVLTTLSAAGKIVRATNDGGWTTSRPRWAATAAWLGEEIDELSVEQGTAALVAEYLRAFGPATAHDIKWWLGSTKTAVANALSHVRAVEVDLGNQATGYLLPDDTEAEHSAEPWAALLPPLDPTTMGWAERDWYLGPYKPQIFDSNGNAGPTAWLNGRVVGGWRQHDSGEVELQLLEDVGNDAMQLLKAEQARLSDWFGGTKVLPRFPTPLAKVPS
jgi:hypothetical protein